MDKEALSLNSKAIVQSKIQSRVYEAKNEEKIFEECCNLLEDLGFTINNKQIELGLVNCTKTRSAVKAFEQTMAFLNFIAGNGIDATDEKQIMSGSVLIRAIGNDKRFISVKIIFQRIIINTEDEITGSETLKRPQIYNEFFEKLSKKILMEPQK